VAREVRLRDGSSAFIWSLLAEDREALARGYSELSAESRYQRFLSGVPELTESMLHRLVDTVDGIDHVALVLVVFDDEFAGSGAGVARMIRYGDDPTAADVAVTVTEAYRGRGVASALLAELLDQRPMGIERIVTHVATDNAASLAMLQRLGRTVVAPAGHHVSEVTVELADRA
jgi:RimJ/RimL family protein N-acetyltransferase